MKSSRIGHRTLELALAVCGWLLPPSEAEDALPLLMGIGFVPPPASRRGSLD